MNDFFTGRGPVITTHAPGRLDVMGGISDYSGSLLLQMPIRQRTTVQLQLRNDSLVEIRSELTKTKSEYFTMDTSELTGVAGTLTYKEIHALLQGVPGGDWAAYVVGCVVVLNKERSVPLCGLNILIRSEVPVGKGVSSSAALEVAVMNGLVQLFDIKMGETELALLAQKAENLVVGAPCGLMDQLSSHLGYKNKLLPLVCQPHEVMEPVNIPPGVSFSAIDSGIRHAVSGASYSDVRAAAFMAYTVIAMAEGASLAGLQMARDTGDWSALPYRGFLANIPPSVFEQKYLALLPDQTDGIEFLSKYGISIDGVTKIEPERIYQLRACAYHPVRENFRIAGFLELLRNFGKTKNKHASLLLMGEAMFQSHVGYGAVGLGNEHTDEIVQRVREAGVANGVYGARITGGGSGGTVCILCYGKEGKETAKRIFNEYRLAHKVKSFFFIGSSDGAVRIDKTTS